jgi:hypothetical protein
MWEASLENAKQPPFGICHGDIRSIWLQVPSFPRARPRMCRREDRVAALNLIEAHSHTLSSFRRQAKWAFPPTWRVLDCGSETLKGKPPLCKRLQYRNMDCRCLGFHARFSHVPL